MLKTNDISIGLTIGLVQSILGHPLDTVKTLLQNGQSFRGLRLFSYYRGVAYPTTASLVFNGTVFPIYNRLQLKNKNAYVSGAMAGVLIAPIDYAFDIGKIRRQTLTRGSLHFRGMTLSCTRTVIAMGLYFGVYTDLTHLYGPLIAGAAAGLANWTVTYPMDLISTRQIAGNLRIRDAIEGNLFKGYIPCALRAVVVNGATFYVYEKLKEYRDTDQMTK